MTLFNYNTNVPLGTDNPSTSQGQFLTNFNSIDGIVNEDMIGFGLNNGGQFKQIRFPSDPSYVVPPAPTVNGSVIFPRAGVAATTAQLFFQNSTNTYQISPIRAWAYCNGTAGGIIAGQSFNVSSVTRTGTGQYTVVMPANVVSTANYGVLITTTRKSGGGGRAIIGNYESQGATSFQVITIDPVAQSVADPFSFSFQVIQI